MSTLAPAAFRTAAGSRFPPGATVRPDGVNFCVYGRYATRVELLLFRDAGSEDPFQVLVQDAALNRSHYFWHVFVAGLPADNCFTWRMDGSDDTARLAPDDIMPPCRQTHHDAASFQAGARSVVVLEARR